jgi:hypothetical protein
MKLSGIVSHIRAAKEHGAGDFDEVSVRFDPHPNSGQKPYVVSFHYDSGNCKVGDIIVVAPVNIPLLK